MKILYKIILIIIIILFAIFYKFIPILNDKLLFHPTKVSFNDFENVAANYPKNSEISTFNANDGTKLTGLLFNHNKMPKWSDTIFLFSHGNGGWIDNNIHYKSLKVLSNYGSIFLYDYRGYGASEGIPSEKGLYDDILGSWNYLINIKNVATNNVIIFGHSLGSSVSSKLVCELVRKKMDLPKALILEAPFSSLSDIASTIYPSLSNFVAYEFDNVKNIKNIGKKIPVCLFHSKSDEMIPYEQSLKIKKTCDCKMIEIYGTHNDPIYDDKVYTFLETLFKT